MNCSGLHSQETAVDEARVLTLLTHQSSNPRALSLCSRPVSFTLRLLAGVVLGGSSCQAGSRLGPEGLGVGRNNVSFAHLVFSSLPPCLSQASPSFPTTDSLPGVWLGHLLPRAFLLGIISLARPRLLPTPLSRHVCQPAGVRFTGWRSLAGLSELVLGSLTCSLSPPHLGWTWGV